MVAYAELHCLSHFSFQRGASSPEELVTRAAALGYQALALTDECSVAGVVRAHAALRALPEPRPALIIGSEFRLADGPKLGSERADGSGSIYRGLFDLFQGAGRAALTLHGEDLQIAGTRNPDRGPQGAGSRERSP